MVGKKTHCYSISLTYVINQIKRMCQLGACYGLASMHAWATSRFHVEVLAGKPTSRQG